ncbi:MAG: KilA-N domain-containing protein [Methylococcales bacterium]|nr:KilA-N domain-containing protein [Methylococcales bacterium]
MTTQLITVEYGSMPVLFKTDGFINATAIAKQFGKKTENYLRTNETKAYIVALQKYLFPAENPITPKSVNKVNQLVTDVTQ